MALRSRGEAALNALFEKFKTDIESVEIPLSAYHNAAAAATGFKNGVQFKNLVETLQRDARSPNAHSQPMDFYNAKMCSSQYQDWINLIDSVRSNVQPPCPSNERAACLPLPSCP